MLFSVDPREVGEMPWWVYIWMQLQVFRTGAKVNAFGNRMDSVVQIFFQNIFKNKKNVVETILFLCVDKKDFLIKCGIRKNKKMVLGCMSREVYMKWNLLHSNIF